MIEVNKSNYVNCFSSVRDLETVYYDTLGSNATHLLEEFAADKLGGLNNAAAVLLRVYLDEF